MSIYRILNTLLIITVLLAAVTLAQTDKQAENLQNAERLAEAIRSGDDDPLGFDQRRDERRQIRAGGHELLHEASAWDLLVPRFPLFLRIP